MMGGSIHHNQAITTTGYTYAGGIGTYTGQATLIDVDIHHNLVAGSSGDAGGMEVGGPTVLNGVRLFANTVLTAHNTYGGGGGLNFYDGWLEMINSSVFANQVISGTGGGIEVEPGKTLTVTNSAIYNNSASTNGGGIFARGTLSIISSTVWGNQAKLGGGIYAIGRLAITGTRFISNSAIGNGLEVLVDGGPTRIVNSIFRSNGAGVESVFVSTTLTSSNQILFSTFAALSGINANVGLYVRKGAVGITNSIFSSLTHGIYNNGGLAYEDYNLFWNDTFTTTSTVGGSNDASGDPRFANFALDDFHLLLGSAAINAGTDAGVMIDSDGLPRPSGGGFDIGAYEYEVIRKVYLPIVLKNF
jgi:predicted outer membrane repeat protein